jgi:hypothetical protein
MTRRLRPLPALAAVFLASGLAHAQPKPTPKPPQPVDVRSELSDEAKRAWDAAKDLAGANNYKAATVEFQRAYELSHNPRVLYNLGVVEKLQTHYARAVDAWEKELHEGADKLTSKEKADITDAISVVNQYVSPVQVTSNEADATLAIDDYVVPGKTPFAEPLRMDVGHHTLTLKKEGFNDATQGVDVASGQKLQVSLKLEPKKKTGMVKVTVQGAPGAILYIDGVDVGPAPYTGELEATHHSVEARAAGYTTVGQGFDLGYRETSNVSLTLAPVKHEGLLHVTAPEGAEIAVDSRKVGTGTWEGVLSSTGSHQLVVTKSGFQTYAAEVNVEEGKPNERNVVLNQQVSTSWVAWGTGTLLVVVGGVVAGYFIFQPASAHPFQGDLPPYIQATNGFHPVLHF